MRCSGRRLIGALGKYRDPRVLAEASRLFAAWKTDPNAIPGSLKATWLGVIARNADAATWEAIHARAKADDGHRRADLALPAARPRPATKRWRAARSNSR